VYLNYQASGSALAVADFAQPELITCDEVQPDNNIATINNNTLATIIPFILILVVPLLYLLITLNNVKNCIHLRSITTANFIPEHSVCCFQFLFQSLLSHKQNKKL
jgi:ABC-type polysaccharide transport system permease subunit